MIIGIKDFQNVSICPRDHISNHIELLMQEAESGKIATTNRDLVKRKDQQIDQGILIIKY